MLHAISGWEAAASKAVIMIRMTLLQLKKQLESFSSLFPFHEFLQNIFQNYKYLIIITFII